jgi:hypothetical protein
MLGSMRVYPLKSIDAQDMEAWEHACLIAIPALTI